MTAEWPVRSNAIGHFTRLPDPDRDSDNFLRDLRQLIRKRGYSMVIPTNDQALAALVRHYDELAGVVHLACPPPHVTKRVLNKVLTQQAATELGIEVPGTVVISDSREFPALFDQIPFPWILKPAEKQSRAEEFKTCILKTKEEVRNRFTAACRFSTPILVQEYCKGVGVGVEVLIHKGECYGVFQHRRLKELPYTGGYAVMAVAESPDPALVRSSLDLLRALQWEGVAMVEYRVNRPDSRSVLMEINGRYWGSISLPVHAGIDFPLYHWQLVQGETVAAPHGYRVGTTWRWTAGYLARLHWLIVAALRSAAARETLLQDLANLPADFSSSVCDPLFDSSDPMAGVFDLLGMVKYLLGSDLRAMFRSRVSDEAGT
jgi:predicted ATP-grasp superfamily ATP-dependent carboligase